MLQVVTLCPIMSQLVMFGFIWSFLSLKVFFFHLLFFIYGTFLLVHRIDILVQNVHSPRPPKSHIPRAIPEVIVSIGTYTGRF